MVELVELCHYNIEHLSGMHPSSVSYCNNDGVTQSGLNPGKSFTFALIVSSCAWLFVCLCQISMLPIRRIKALL